MKNIPEIFGSMVFNDDAMRERLPRDVYRSLSKTIENGTALYSSFGPGTLHRFYDENGEELTFELKGGELSYENFTLTVEGVADLSLINLFVEGEYVD